MQYKNINLNLYKIFYEVAKCGSISAASKKLYVSQPAVSNSIRNLEEELNVKLFYRNLNGSELTEKWKELLYHVEEAYNSLVIGERKILEDDLFLNGRLSIGVPSHIGTFFIFDKVEEFHKLYPNIEITIRKFIKVTIKVNDENGGRLIVSDSTKRKVLVKHAYLLMCDALNISPSLYIDVDDNEIPKHCGFVGCDK